MSGPGWQGDNMDYWYEYGHKAINLFEYIFDIPMQDTRGQCMAYRYSIGIVLEYYTCTGTRVAGS